VVLVDSSVWVRVEHERVSLSELVPNDEVAICPIVLFEVLRGTRDAKRYGATRRMLMGVDVLDAPTPLTRFEEAAQIYLQCRNAGVTPSVADCLVAACAMAHGIPLLHNDTDFEHIARVTQLVIFTRS
jgi:predicted nucleic acid-binding protein